MNEHCSAREFGEGGLAVCRPVFTRDIAHRPPARARVIGESSSKEMCANGMSERAGPKGLETSVSESEDLWGEIWAPLLGTDMELSQTISLITMEPVNGCTRSLPGLTQESTCPAVPETTTSASRRLLPSFRSRSAPKATKPRTQSTSIWLTSLPTNEHTRASTGAFIAEPFERAFEAAPSIMNHQYIKPTVNPGIRAMPNTLVPAPVSTTPITKTMAATITSTITSTITEVLSATGHHSIKDDPSSEYLDKLVCNATNAVAEKFGLVPTNLTQYMPFTRRLVTALVLGGTAGSAYLYGRYYAGQAPPPPNEDEQLQCDLQDVQQAEEADEQILRELSEARKRIAELEKQEALLQAQVHRETWLREKGEAKVRKAKKTTATPGKRSTSHSQTSLRSSPPITPIQQAIRKSYQETIEAKTERLLRKDVTSPQLADEIYDEVYERVSSHTPPRSTTKRKLSFIDNGDQAVSASASPLMSTPQAQPLGPESRTNPVPSPPHKLDFANPPKTAPAEESPPKRARIPAPEVAVALASPTPTSLPLARRSLSPRRSPRKQKMLDLSEKALGRRSVTPGDE